MKWIIRIAVVVVLLVVAGLVVLFLNLNSIVKKGVETVGPKITKTEVKLNSVSLSPFSGSGQLKGLVVGNPEGFTLPSAIKVGGISVKVSLASLKSDTIVVESVQIESPEITVEGGLTGNNLSKLLANVDASVAAVTGGKTDQPAGPAAGGKKFQVKDITIQNVKANLSLKGLGKSLSVTIPDIHLRNIGTAEKGVTAAELTKKILGEIIPAVLQAATKAATDVGNLGKDAGKAAVNQADKAAKGIKGLFGK